jgi:hypothetical protein
MTLCSSSFAENSGGAARISRESVSQFYTEAGLPDVLELQLRSAMGNQPSSRLRGPPRIRSDVPNALGLSKAELDERCKPSGYVFLFDVHETND